MFGIRGLLYIPNYIDNLEHCQLVQTIDTQPWREDLSRRTQHYGYVYDYRARRVDTAMRLGELPDWLQKIALRLRDDGLSSKVPDQAIINEYCPGQGIADHIDCKPCFGEAIVSLSLVSSAVMHLRNRKQLVPILLEPRSLIVLRNDARYKWTHGIARRKQDIINGTTIWRERRLSITFRKIVDI
jgi:alkylated DNA repair dioxygenase AlkB